VIYKNKSESVLSPGPFSQLIKILNCPCADGVRRTIHRIGTPDTMWTAPGRVYVKGRTITGFISSNDEGYKFHANKYGKNYGLLSK